MADTYQPPANPKDFTRSANDQTLCRRRSSAARAAST
jgi:hypothetical protein